MSAYKEVLRDNDILVLPKNPKALAKETRRLLRNDTETKYLVLKAQKFIKKYSSDSVGKKLEEVYFKFTDA